VRVRMVLVHSFVQYIGRKDVSGDHPFIHSFIQSIGINHASIHSLIHTIDILVSIAVNARLSRVMEHPRVPRHVS